LGYLVQACSRIVGRQNLKKGEPPLEFARQVLLDVSATASTEEVLKTRESFDQSPSGGSPQSLVDAASGLMFLAATPDFSETGIYDAIRRLSQNVEPAVRLQIAVNLHLLERTAPGTMWNLIAFISRQEPSRAVLQSAVASISTLADRYPERVLPLLERIHDRTTSGTGHERVRAACFNSFLGLYLWRGLLACDRRLPFVVNTPWENPEIASHLAHTIRDDLARGPTSPSDPEQDGVRGALFR
jgi:hypothetical protein